MKVNDIRDGINFITSKEKPLAAYIFTNDRNLKEDFVQQVSAGGIAVNEVTIHVSLFFLLLQIFFFCQILWKM